MMTKNWQFGKAAFWSNEFSRYLEQTGDVFYSTFANFF